MALRGPGDSASIRRVAFRVEGLNEAMRIFRNLEPAAQKPVRDASWRIATKTSQAAHAQAAMTGYRIHRLAAQSLRARRDRVPVLILGNAKVLPGREHRRNKRRQTYNAIAAGAEFGGSRGSMAAKARLKKGRSLVYHGFGGRIRVSTFKASTSQFPPYRQSATGKGGEGYFLYPTIHRLGPYYLREWSEAMETAIKRA
jgi:hypothetical protein